MLPIRDYFNKQSAYFDNEVADFTSSAFRLSIRDRFISNSHYSVGIKMLNLTIRLRQTLFSERSEP